MPSLQYAFGAVTAACVLGVGYAIYFDQKRQNDPEFRRQLKLERKRIKKLDQEKAAELAARNESRARAAAAQQRGGIPQEALDELANEPVPTTDEGRQAYFMKQLQYGEQLMAAGAEYFPAAADCFIRVLDFYPDGEHLLQIIKSTCPPEVYSLVIEKNHKNILDLQSRYLEHYPPPNMNVKLKETKVRETDEGKVIFRRGLVVTKSFKKGDLIYTEDPMVCSLFTDVEGEFCSFCFKNLPKEPFSLKCKSESDIEKLPLYCSQECLNESFAKYGKFLYPDFTQEKTEGAKQPKSQHQKDIDALIESARKEWNNISPLMVVKFIAELIHDSNNKGPYSLFDHFNRYHYLDLTRETTLLDGSKSYIVPPDQIEKESKLVLNAVPGIESLFSRMSYIVLKGKFLYNMIGLTSTSSSTITTTCIEQCRTKTTSNLIGVGLYHITSYLSHSCSPNTVFEFGAPILMTDSQTDGTSNKANTLRLIATADLNEGDEIFTAWSPFDVDIKERRKELKRKYRFSCKCEEACKGNY